MLTLRIFSLLPSLISRHHNGFVPSRLIWDSIISMHENIHSLKVSKKEGFLFKLDISKAYDRVDWAFLQRGFKAFGFNKRFRDLVLMMVSSATF